MDSRKGRLYNNLQKKLKRLGLQNNGTLAGLLLGHFPQADSYATLYFHMFTSKGLCALGGFKAYKEYLLRLGVLDYVEVVQEDGRDYSYFKLGPSIKRLWRTQENKQIEKLTQRVEELEASDQNKKKQIEDIWTAIRDIQENNPPVTEEKIERHLKLVDDGWGF